MTDKGEDGNELQYKLENAGLCLGFINSFDILQNPCSASAKYMECFVNKVLSICYYLNS